MSTTTPLEELAGRHEEYVRFVQQRFFRKLSHEDCADAVQEAFAAASRSDTCPQLDPVQLDLWLRRAAYNKAIDVLRASDREGQGAVRRPAASDIDALAEILPDAPLAEDDPADDDARAVFDAFQRLPAFEQRVIGLRHLDNLPRETCAELLGLPVTKYKRAHTEAVRRLINLVVETRPHDTCLEARSLIQLSVNDLLDTDSAARRDAHLAGCAHCRQYQRRSRGLLVFLPPPAVALSDRVAARLHDLLERLPFVAQADPSAATGGIGVLGLGGAKIAALAATGMAAAGGGAVAVINHRSDQEPPAAVVRARPATQVSVTRAPPAAPLRPAIKRATRTKTPTRVKHQHKDRTTSPAANAGRVKPPGHEVSTAPAAQSASTVATPTPASSRTTSPAVTAPSTTHADTSSGEFAPHP